MVPNNGDLPLLFVPSPEWGGVGEGFGYSSIKIDE
jgi:hypothetical protein